MDVFKKEIKDEVTHLLYDQTRRTPIVIPVVNEIGGGPKQASQESSSQESFKKPPTKKFPPKQVPDTEVVEPKNRERTRGY